MSINHTRVKDFTMRVNAKHTQTSLIEQSNFFDRAIQLFLLDCFCLFVLICLFVFICLFVLICLFVCLYFSLFVWFVLFVFFIDYLGQFRVKIKTQSNFFERAVKLLCSLGLFDFISFLWGWGSFVCLYVSFVCLFVF